MDLTAISLLLDVAQDTLLKLNIFHIKGTEWNAGKRIVVAYAWMPSATLIFYDYSALTPTSRPANVVQAVVDNPPLEKRAKWMLRFISSRGLREYFESHGGLLTMGSQSPNHWTPVAFRQVRFNSTKERENAYSRFGAYSQNDEGAVPRSGTSVS